MASSSNGRQRPLSARLVTEECGLEEDLCSLHFLEVDGSRGTAPSSKWRSMSNSGTVFDGFLLAASSEVGQSLLTLPHIFAQVGFTMGLILEFLFATLALHTNFLLVSMHAQHRHKMKLEDDPRHRDPYHIVTYHEIMDSLVGSRLKNLSLVVVFFALLGLAPVQIIATASNFYILSDSISKRSWALMWGSLFSLVAFVPTFRHYRILAIVGIMTTTYTSWFMTVTSIVEGKQDDATYDAPTSTVQFFTGLVQLLFINGGHSTGIEVADVLDDPSSYDISYFWSYLYIFTLTMPNAFAAYHTYGQECFNNTNAFNLFPRSIYRDFGIIMMSLHQAIAFGLFVAPLFHIWEDFLRVHDEPFKVRAVARLPLCALMLFLAVAFPFFGAINAILGAFTTSFGTFIIPCIGYNLAFPSSENMVKAPAVDIKWVRRINWAICATVFLVGFVAGGYTSLRNFFEKLDRFDFFAKCYQC
eukprot:scaffold3103_cov136-Cylindrotheca_fusiformis.AAC.10